MSDFETPEQRRQDDEDGRRFHAKVSGEPAPVPYLRDLLRITQRDANNAAAELSSAHAAAERACIRPGETLAELIARLYSETLDRDDD